MIIEHMINNVVKRYGFETKETIMFCWLCRKPIANCRTIFKTYYNLIYRNTTPIKVLIKKIKKIFKKVIDK